MLKKLQMALLKINVPMVVFFAYSLKVLIFNPSYQDGIVLAIMAGLFGYKMKIDLIKPINSTDDNLKREVAEIKNALSKVNLASISKPPRKF